MAGRPPKPTALKLLQGNAGKRKLNVDEPKPPLGAHPPAWLSKAARTVWAQLAPVLEHMGVLTQADAIVLGNLCQLQAQFNKQARRGEASGKLAAELRQHYGRFGLTPADRARVKVEKPKDDTSKLARFRA